MRISTWNIERLKHRKSLPKIVSLCESANADIMVLTETNNQIQLNYDNCFYTDELSDSDLLPYEKHENRVSIYTDYKCVAFHDTYDRFTSICVELETEKGNLLVYGTIIGVFGNRHPSFSENIGKLEEDIKRLLLLNKPICVIGDFNLSFCDNYYFTYNGRNSLQILFEDCDIGISTRNVPECIDHIAITNRLFEDHKVHISEWNEDKALSDHKGIVVEF